MSQEVKEEFKSCMTTGILGALLGVSIVWGAYSMTNDLKSSGESKQNTAQPISSQKGSSFIVSKEEKQR